MVPFGNIDSAVWAALPLCQSQTISDYLLPAESGKGGHSAQLNGGFGPFAAEIIAALFACHLFEYKAHRLPLLRFNRHLPAVRKKVNVATTTIAT